MGDVLSLIERAEKAYDHSQAEALQKKLRRNAFDLEDFREQLRAVKKMGAVSELLGMIPGMKKMLRGTDLSGAEDELKHVEAIIDSMTRAERKNIQLLNASRRKRIARGSGTSVADVNRLINQFTHTKKVLKQLGWGATGPRIPGLRGLPRCPLPEGVPQGSKDPPRPPRRQEEPLLPHRGRQRGVAARRALHRAGRRVRSRPLPHPDPVSGREAGRLAQEGSAAHPDRGAPHPQTRSGRHHLLMMAGSRIGHFPERAGGISRQAAGEPPRGGGGEGDAG